MLQFTSLWWMERWQADPQTFLVTLHGHPSIYPIELWAWQRRPTFRPISARHEADPPRDEEERTPRMKKTYFDNCGFTLQCKKLRCVSIWMQNALNEKQKSTFCWHSKKKRKRRHTLIGLKMTSFISPSRVLCLSRSPLKDSRALPALPKESRLFRLRWTPSTKSSLRVDGSNLNDPVCCGLLRRDDRAIHGVNVRFISRATSSNTYKNKSNVSGRLKGNFRLQMSSICREPNLFTCYAFSNCCSAYICNPLHS